MLQMTQPFTAWTAQGNFFARGPKKSFSTTNHFFKKIILFFLFFDQAAVGGKTLPSSSAMD